MAIEKSLDETLKALKNNQLTTLIFSKVKKEEKQYVARCVIKREENEKSYGSHFALLSDGSVIRGETIESNLAKNTKKIVFTVWNVQTGQCVKQFDYGESERSTLDFLEILPTGQMITISHQTIKLWDIRRGKCLNTIGGGFSLGELWISSPQRHWIWGKKVLRNGYFAHVATGGSCGKKDCVIKIWDVSKESCLKTLSGHTGSVSSIESLLLNERIISGSQDDTLRVWDTKTGKCLQTLQCMETLSEAESNYQNGIRYILVLSNGQIVSGGCQWLEVWDLQAGKRIQTLSGHTDYINCVALLPYDQVITGSKDSTLRVWEPKTGKCLRILEGHTGSVSHVAVLPGGQVISTGFNDSNSEQSSTTVSTLKIWDINTGKCLQTLDAGHIGWEGISTIVLPDGRVFSNSDNALVLWEQQMVALELAEEEYEALLDQATKNISLTTLDLSSISLAKIPQGIALLSILLKQHPNLISLNLSYTGLTDTMLDELLPVLSVQKHIQATVVEGNPF